MSAAALAAAVAGWHAEHWKVVRPNDQIAADMVAILREGLLNLQDAWSGRGDPRYRDVTQLAGTIGAVLVDLALLAASFPATLFFYGPPDRMAGNERDPLGAYQVMAANVFAVAAELDRGSTRVCVAQRIERAWNGIDFFCRHLLGRPTTEVIEGRMRFLAGLAGLPDPAVPAPAPTIVGGPDLRVVPIMAVLDVMQRQRAVYLDIAEAEKALGPTAAEAGRSVVDAALLAACNRTQDWLAPHGLLFVGSPDVDLRNLWPLQFLTRRDFRKMAPKVIAEALAAVEAQHAVPGGGR